VIYVGSFALLAGAWITLLLLIRPSVFLDPVIADPVVFLTFLGLAGATRLMAFPIAAAGSFALDTSVYVAAMLTMGAGPASLVAVGAMLFKGLIDLVRRETEGIHWPAITSVAKLFFAPMVTGAVVATFGFGAEVGPLEGYLDRGMSLAMGAFTLLVLSVIALQFPVVAFSYRLSGLSWKRVARDVAGPGILGELAFLPLGFALTFAYRDRDAAVLLAIAVSYLIFVFVYRRLWTQTSILRQRNLELALVEEVGRASSSTFDLEEVGRRIGVALLDSIDGSLGVVLNAFDDSGGYGRQFVRAVDREDKPAILDAARRNLDLVFERSGRKVRRGTGAGSRTGGSDWTVLGTPLLSPTGGADLGYLSLVMGPGHQGTDRDRRILGHIARPAAIAVSNWRLYNLATEDGLTGLFVRRYVESRLREEFERSSRSGSSFCLLMIDVDELKQVNDRHGHAAGDRLLRAVSKAIRGAVRGMDVPGRWGGDEFAVLLPDMSLQEGADVARRLTDLLADGAFQIGSDSVRPSVSIGVAACPESEPLDASRLVELADAALYRVKRSGKKGTVVLAEPGMSGGLSG
jgi:diguanylate cyclase (GGDEF)-like protein